MFDHNIEVREYARQNHVRLCEVAAVCRMTPAALYKLLARRELTGDEYYCCLKCIDRIAEEKDERRNSRLEAWREEQRQRRAEWQEEQRQRRREQRAGW